MMRLKSKLLSLNAQKTTKTKVFSPRNTEELRIPFKTDKTAKVVGKLAAVPPPKITPIPEDGEEPADGVVTAMDENGDDAPLVTGVLVQNDFKLSLMAPEDLLEYAGLNTTIITCKQRLILSAAGIDLIKWALEGTFGAVEELPEMRRAELKSKANGDADTEMADAKDEIATAADEEVAILVAAYLVMGCITVRYRTNGEVELEWEGNMLNDGIADSVMAVLFSVESSPAAVKRSASKNPHTHSHSHGELDPATTKNPHANVSPADRLERLLWFLEAQFGEDNVSPVETPRLPAITNGGEAEKTEETEAGGEAEDGQDAELAERQRKEVERLHKIGIPVPGIAITVDKMAAKVWLEDLEVECSNKVFADRVKAVVERAVEVTAPLWG